MGELQRHVRDHGWAVHLSRRLKELAMDVQRTLDSLQRDLRRTPTVGEIACSLRVDPDAVVDALRAASARTAQSLDAPAVDGDAEPIVSSLGCEEPGYDLVEQRALLRALAPRLSQCERTVLWLRLEHDLTQREIARRVGVSQATIARAQHVVARELSRLSDGIGASSGGAPASSGA
jgi:RNA polymerase sigma-B factor